MAWRDSRRNRGRLLLFISSIILGIAALVAINSFSENLQKDIDSEAKTLLGADLVVEGNQRANDSLSLVLDSLQSVARARSLNFVSMVYFPKGGNTRLAQVKALEGDFPFYGNLITMPESASLAFRKSQRALVEKTMMLQFGLEPGDSIQIGNLRFEIAGQLNSSPGRSGIAGSIAPVVYMPMQFVEATGLVQEGSRIWYQYYFKFDEEVNVDELAESRLKPAFENTALNYETVEMRKESIGEAFKNLATFLNLVGFIALLLGCIGVASSVHIYIKDKLATIAILRCLGAKGRQAFWIYLIQVIALGIVGGIIGALTGSFLQVVLPKILGDFLPVQTVSNDISWMAIGGGVLTGLGITILFALLPLLAIRRISPLSALRASFEGQTRKRDPVRWLVFGLIFLFITGFTYIQTGEKNSIFFPIAVTIAFLLLAGVAKLLTWLVRKFFPVGWNYIWRQAIANLYRPNNQTLILIVTIGLGTALLSTLFFTRDLLLKQVEFASTGKQPNMIVFDIQTPQKESVAKLTQKYKLPLIQQVPIVTMRLDNIDGVTKEMYLKDSTSEVSEWIYNREWRCTYRDTLIDSEKIVEGVWRGEVAEDGTIYVSVADNVVRNMKAKVGTKLTFNVQGALVETVIGSIRKVDFSRVQTNFFVLFPKGVLETAPQFHVIVSRVESEGQSARYQQALVQQFPNVSAIDLTQILRSVEDVLNKVSFVIRFMALFSILTGLLVLISSVVLSKYQRIKESVLLRTLGASRRQILRINALEYFFLGTFATGTGIGLSIIGSWAMAHFSFEVPFSPNWLPPFLVFLIITALTVLIGLLNSREVLTNPPLEVLRREVG